MKDRMKGYVPDPFASDELRPKGVVLIRSGKEEMAHSLVYALADDLNRDQQSLWFWAEVIQMDESGPVEHWSHFLQSAHQVTVDVELTTWNHREVHDWKGYDEIRGAGHYTIKFNRELVYGGRVGDVARTLVSMSTKIDKLKGLPVDWNDPIEGSVMSLIGRPVWYLGVEAFVRYVFPDDGHIVLKTTGKMFPRYAYGAPTDGTYDYDEGTSVKLDILSDRIAWYRDVLPEETIHQYESHERVEYSPEGKRYLFKSNEGEK